MLEDTRMLRSWFQDLKEQIKTVILNVQDEYELIYKNREARDLSLEYSVGTDLTLKLYWDNLLIGVEDHEYCKHVSVVEDCLNRVEFELRWLNSQENNGVNVEQAATIAANRDRWNHMKHKLEVLRDIHKALCNLQKLEESVCQHLTAYGG